MKASLISFCLMNIIHLNALAQFNVVNSFPSKNSVGVSVSQSIVLQFNQNIALTNSFSSFELQSRLEGKILFSFQINDNSLVITPQKSFQYSDEITLTLNSSFESATGAALGTLYSVRFTTETKPAPAVRPEFIGKTLLNDYQKRVQKIVSVDLDHDADIDLVSLAGPIVWLENTGNDFVMHEILTLNDFLNDLNVFDIDQDGDFDILFSSTYHGIVILSNDGAQNFSQIVIDNSTYTTGFDIADFDSDGNFDIVASSDERTIVNQYYQDYKTTSIFYGGNGAFSRKVISPTYGYHTKCVDLDNDGDWDLLQHYDDTVIAIRNNSGTFEIDTLLANQQPYIQDVFAQDLNADHIPEIVIASGGALKMLGSDQSSNYTLKTINSSYGVNYQPAFGDFDGDKDLDIVFMNGNYRFSMMENDGQANFIESEVTQAPEDQVYSPANIAIADFDGDGDLDFASVTSYWIIRLYSNVIFPFSESKETTFKSLTNGDADWGDFDNDGDLDLLTNGLLNDTPLTILYENQGGQLVEKSTSLPGLYLGSCDWGDFDNDGDLDILLIGAASGGIDNRDPKSFIYLNRGGDFELLKSNLPGTYYGKARWADFNNDGFSDIVFNSMFATGVYQSDGTGNFSQRFELPSIFQYGNVDVGDYDHDGDIDIVVTGWRGNEELGAELKIYRNDGDWSFIEVQGDFLGRVGGNVNWWDMDNDGDLDLLVGGMVWSSWGSNQSMTVYENTGTHFQSLTNSEFIYQVDWYGTTSIGDYDNNGIPDVMTSSGGGSYYNPTLILFNNNGHGDLTSSNIYLPQNISRVIAWADYDQDHDLDFFAQPKLIRNNITTKNTTPSAPSNIKVDSVFNNSVYFHWEAGSDKETATPGLSYQIYAGTQSKTQDVMNSNADISTGKRKIAEQGVVKGLFTHIEKIKGGKYFFGVQAIDASFEGSPFSDELEIKVVGILGGPSACLGKNYTYIANPSGSYAWQVKGGEIVSGQGNDTLVVKWNSKGRAIIKVAGITGEQNSLLLDIDEAPNPVISGNTKVCSGIESYVLNDDLTYFTEWSVIGSDTATSTDSHHASVNWSSEGEQAIVAKAFSQHRGCSSSDTLTIQIDRKPNAYFEGAYSTCAGRTEQYSTLSTNPEWKFINGTVTMDSVQKVKVHWSATATTGTVVLKEKSTHGFCIAVDSVVINIFPVPPMPTIQVRKGVKADTLISSPSPSNYYIWYWNDSSVVTGLYRGLITRVSGLFNVEIFSEHYCGVKSAYVLIDIEKGTVTETLKQDYTFNLYPNPAKSIVTTELTNNTIGKVVMNIYSLSGQQVKQIQADKTDLVLKQDLNISELSPGLYILKVLLGNEVWTTRFLKY